jgi:amino acid transporter
VYGWALFTTIAAVSVGAGPFLSTFVGLPNTPFNIAVVALLMVLLATIINMMGTQILARVAMFGFICELVGAIAVGGYLYIFGRHQSPAVLFQTFSITLNGSYLPAFAAAALAGLFTCYGFEACGDVAEETPNPGSAIPKSMRRTIYVGMGASIFVVVALVLSVPNLGAALSGKDADPLTTILRSEFGGLGERLVIGLVMVSFVSCALSLQAAASRVLYAYARDGMVVGSQWLTKISSRNKVPVNSLLIAGIIPAIIDILGYFMPNALNIIVSFAVAGIYIAFQMVVWAALVARIKGWNPLGQFSLRQWGWPINIIAAIYGALAIVNMIWARTPNVPWYLNWAVLLMTALVVLVGLIYLTFGRPYDRGNAPAGDAWKPGSTKI